MAEQKDSCQLCGCPAVALVGSDDRVGQCKDCGKMVCTLGCSELVVEGGCVRHQCMVCVQASVVADVERDRAARAVGVPSPVPPLVAVLNEIVVELLRYEGVTLGASFVYLLLGSEQGAADVKA